MKLPQVLIAGSGLAAYFVWRQLGKNAIVVSDSLTNNSLISGHCFCTKSPDSRPLEKAMIETGRRLADKKLVKFFCNRAKGIGELPEFKEKAAWSLGFKPNFDFLEKFQKKALHAKVVELEVSKNRLDSATIQLPNGKTQTVCCDAIVLCTGGFSHYFAPADSADYSSPTGLEVAFNAGAVVSGLEFNMFHPFGLDGKCVQTEFLSKCKLSGSKGIEWLKESIMQKSLHSQLSKASKAIFQEPGGKLKAKMNGKTFSLAPISHFSNGGLVVDCNSQTSIQGVFAAGEIASGLHGAERIGGTALSEAVVFGSNAGKKAADYCIEENVRALSFKNAERKSSFSECKKILSKSFRIMNCRESLAQGLEEAQKKECLFAQAVFKAGLLRKESRGCFSRLDFPEESKKFEKNFFFKAKKCGLTHFKE